jgi:hypothetical protein
MPTFTAKTVIQVDGTYSGSAGLLTGPIPVALNWRRDWTSGSGSGQANRVATASGELAATTVNFDFFGGLVDIFGNTINAVKIKEIWLQNEATTSGHDLDISGTFFTGITGAGADGMLKGWVDDAVTLTLPPGARWKLDNPIDGWIVTTATMDVLTLDSGANTVDYKFVAFATQ